MINNTRKYKLDVCSTMSHGVGVSGTTIQHNLLNSFNSFPIMTTNELKGISVPNFNERVKSFLEFVGIESGILKTRLEDEASYFDPNCVIQCSLNSNFLVYRFLDGVRIVDVGEANGDVEYFAYPIDDDPNNYSWQNNGTFLGIDLSKIYIFKIRDMFTGEVVCEYQKEISLPLLLPSTTQTLTPVLIGLEETTRQESSYICYAYGNTISTPTLSTGQKVLVDYVVNVDAFGFGISNVEFLCKRPVDSSFQSFSNTTNGDTTPKTVSIEMNSEIEWCYNIVAETQYHGASASADFCLSTVGGQNTTIPSIDLTSCSASISNCSEPINVTASTHQLSCVDNVGTKQLTGCFNFDLAIPEHNDISLDLSVNTSNYGSANSCVVFYCKPNGSASPPMEISKTSDGESCTPTIVVNYGDVITYDMVIEASIAGTEGVAEFSMLNSSGSYGINSYISDVNYCEHINASTQTQPVTVSVCRGFEDTFIRAKTMNGFINAPNMVGNQCVEVVLTTNTIGIGGGTAFVEATCQINGTGGEIRLFCVDINTAPTTETFFIRPNDVIRYCGEVTIPDYPSIYLKSESELKLIHVSGYNGVEPTIDAGLNKSDAIITIEQLY